MTVDACKGIGGDRGGTYKNGLADGRWAHIEDIDLAALVQFACMEGGERLLIVRCGDADGEIFFSGGEMVHALYKDTRGEDAFFDLIRSEPDSFLLKRASAPERSIHAPWNFLLLEALRRKDEAGRTSSFQMAGALPVVFVISRSTAVCTKIEGILREDCGVKVIVKAGDWVEAKKRLSVSRPDLVVIDMETSEPNKELAVKHFMMKSAAPALLFGSVNHANCPKVMDFLRLGVMDIIAVPNGDGEWAQVSKRFKGIVSSLKGLRLANIRRIKQQLALGHKKVRPGPPADRLLVVIGGMGGLIELQKVISVLPAGESLSMAAFQDMAVGCASVFAGAMDQIAAVTVSCLQTEGPLLSSLCWVTDWNVPWEVVRGDGALIRHPGYWIGTEADGVRFDSARFISTASQVFGPNLAILLLSGADVNIKQGLDEAVSRGCHIWLQIPDTAVYPAPLDEIRSWEFEEACIPIEVEQMGRLIKRWCRGEALWQDF
ncbi:response regulator [Dissulfurimicrobium hydrothermale]|uniref:response regulator n=1 Tax=Dissulfurimicrobium hydrothermale TaxID=1750598 RepID=UPI001EDA34BB|nr:DUF4388 domain-containing protein [Dissulfurimicrobium hydrothermale]UKL14597.1 DUF4388 domain-containing protein [Dissulfurimicrobium hydrothermale]